jgi:hypothetical protein
MATDARMREVGRPGEQQAIVDAYRTSSNLVIEVGTGKTTTLKMLGTGTLGRVGIYRCVVR